MRVRKKEKIDESNGNLRLLQKRRTGRYGINNGVKEGKMRKNEYKKY